ncbi:alpha-tocopherol transfer protein-like [Arctopsyche grandis]|uniref:alpha-tocopherol transfer protein-like n=1 Tax=Arctopsyche grandis TaxID=121162 RepID=UPI00406D8DCB
MAILYGPTKEQMAAIESEIGGNDRKFEENLETLKVWIKNQSYIPKDYDDYLLPLFLRGCKQNVARTQQKLTEFYKTRNECNTLYHNWNPTDPGITAAMKFMEHAPLPRLTDDGYRVVFHKIGDDDDDANLKDIIRLLLMLAELRMEQEHAIAGDIYIFDVKNLKISFMIKLLSPLLKKVLDIIQNAYPQRLKQIHVINAPTFIYSTIKFIKGFMKEKMKHRFIIHTSQDTLHEYISKDILPSDYQGQAESVSEISAKWIEKLQSSKEKFKEHNSRFNSIKNVQTMKESTHSDIYCAEGVFRSLTID